MPAPLSRAGRLVVAVAACALAAGAAAVGPTAHAATTTTAPAPRVVGGQVVKEGAWPSQVALLRSRFASPKAAQFCSGTLISDRWVLTAAHCVAGVSPEKMQVAIGFTRLPDITAADRVGVDRIVSHAKFGFEPGHDIAVIHLSAPQPGPYAKLISLAQRGTWGEGSLATVSGWGRIYQDGPRSQVMRQADVPIVSDRRCAPIYEGDFDPRTDLCAGWLEVGGRDTCQGDSGGPMWLPIGRTWYQVGVVSRGEGCAQPGFPGVYADVENLRGWIADQTAAG